MTTLRLLRSIALAAISLFAFASDTLLVNVDEAHPPYMYNSDGKAAGFYSALVQAAFQRMDVPVTLMPKPWARAIHEMDQGLSGTAGIYKNSERLKRYDYSEPLLVERLMVYSPRSRFLPYTRIEDLKGKRVGVMRGWSYGDEFDKARKAGLFKVEDVSTDEQNFLKLSTDRIDVMVAIPESVSSLLTRFPSVTAASTPLLEAPAYLAFSKSANQAALLQRFNQALKEMKASGEFLRILTEEFAHP